MTVSQKKKRWECGREYVGPHNFKNYMNHKIVNLIMNGTVNRFYFIADAPIESVSIYRSIESLHNFELHDSDIYVWEKLFSVSYGIYFMAKDC